MNEVHFGYVYIYLLRGANVYKAVVKVIGGSQPE
jgi:hypothetical protein